MSKSRWKGPFVKKEIKTDQCMLRGLTITPSISNSTFYVHSGNTFEKVEISKEMLGHKLGEFVPTRVKFEHKKKKKKKKKSQK